MTGKAAPAYRLWLACALTKLAIFTLAGREYGYLSDELYFLDAASHLAAGYLDFPPAIAWVMAALTWPAGNDLLILRGFACLTGIAVTIVSIDICRQLGGGRVAQGITALVVLFAPAFLSVQSILTMNVLDQLWWAMGFWLLIRYLEEREPRFMLALGVVYGVSLLTKLAMPVWFVALGLSVLIYARWTLRQAEVWQAAGLMLIVASPFLFWQVANDWPFIEFMAAYNAESAEAMVIDQPIFGLITTMNPPFLLIWLPGLIYGLLARDRTHRLLGTAATICLALYLLAGVKFYFATPLFILFTAFGGLLWERWLAGRRRLAGGFLAGMALSGLFSVPIAAPVLPPVLLQQVADFIRDGEQGSPGQGPARMGRYFPHFAEMHGWQALAERVTQHYEAIPAVERDGVKILAAFFGQAGAINQLDPDHRLPTAFSGHMAYYHWAEGQSLDDTIAIGFSEDELNSMYQEVQVLEQFECERCMARENGLIIARARIPQVDSDEIRRLIKRFYFF